VCFTLSSIAFIVLTIKAESSAIITVATSSS
jgi:hypothetical protein